LKVFIYITVGATFELVCLTTLVQAQLNPDLLFGMTVSQAPLSNNAKRYKAL